MGHVLALFVVELAVLVVRSDSLLSYTWDDMLHKHGYLRGYGVPACLPIRDGLNRDVENLRELFLR